MTDKANSISKLLFASRASQCHGISWWPIGIGFAFSALSFSFTYSLSLIESCSFDDETSYPGSQAPFWGEEVTSPAIVGSNTF